VSDDPRLPPRALAIEELQRLLRAEPHLAAAFRVLARRAQAKPLRKLCREGVTYTNRRVRRIRAALRALDAPARPKPSQGLDGLIADALKAASSHGAKSPECDAAILAAVERISHDGLATYAAVDRYLRAARASGARKILAPSLKEKREAVAEEAKMAREELLPELR
jgi:ferritin-like metal-binding protein YciE